MPLKPHVILEDKIISQKQYIKKYVAKDSNASELMGLSSDKQYYDQPSGASVVYNQFGVIGSQESQYGRPPSSI